MPSTRSSFPRLLLCLGLALTQVGLSACTTLPATGPIVMLAGKDTMVFPSPKENETIQTQAASMRDGQLTYNGGIVDPKMPELRSHALGDVDYPSMYAAAWLKAEAAGFAATPDLQQAVIGSRPLVTVTPAAPNIQALVVRDTAVINLVGRSVGLGGFQSKGLGVAGLIVGVLTSDSGGGGESRADKFYRQYHRWAWERLTGSTLNLVSFQAATQGTSIDHNPIDAALRIAEAARLPGNVVPARLAKRAAIATYARELRMSNIAERSKLAGAPPAFNPTAIVPSGVVELVVDSRAYAASPYAAAAKLFPNGSFTTMIVPHVYYQDRDDGITSGRELYDKLLVPSGTLSNEWILVYADIDPADNERKIFVTRHGSKEVLTFPLPPAPSL